jgi:hypothetical protein
VEKSFAVARLPLAFNLPKIILLALTAFPAAGATLFTNGSFESPGAPGDPWVPGVRYVGDESLDGSGTGWIHEGAANAAAFFGDFYTNGDGGGFWSMVPQDGSYYFGFGATGKTGGVLKQTFDTEIGVTYVVNYWLTTQELDEGPFPDQVAFVAAYDGAILLASVENILNGPPGWSSGLTLTFTASSASTTLLFRDDSSAGTPGLTLGPNDTFLTNWGLDNVSLAMATPEPGSWALLGLGLVALGAAKRVVGQFQNSES